LFVLAFGFSAKTPAEKYEQTCHKALFVCAAVFEFLKRLADG
jgi:hypothetical protein